MKVLFIGGTGIISSASSELAVARGVDLYHLNRGQSSSLRRVNGVTTMTADIRNISQAKKALGDHSFDAVVQWIAFHPDDILRDIELFKNRTKQYVFISSASAYQTPPEKLPVTEETILENPVWEYSQNKIACENLLRKSWKETGFPFTIIRPSHTYDKTLIPLEGGYTVFDRMLKGKPIVIHGDGSSLWTLTHHKDFAKGLVGILGKREAINQAYHITSDELLSWDQIARILAAELGVEPRIVHVPSEIIAGYDKTMGDSLLGDKTHSMIFDNTKIKSIVPEFAPKIPFRDGAREIAAWYKNNPARQRVDKNLDSVFTRIISDYSRHPYSNNLP